MKLLVPLIIIAVAFAAVYFNGASNEAIRQQRRKDSPFWLRDGDLDRDDRTR